MPKVTIINDPKEGGSWIVLHRLKFEKTGAWRCVSFVTRFPLLKNMQTNLFLIVIIESIRKVGSSVQAKSQNQP